MSNNHDGGPAFPTAADNGHSNNQDGMTLRDWFAGQAISAAVLTEDCESADWNSAASYAYELADAMLRARKVSPEK